VHIPGSVRVGAAWLLTLPFLVLSRPTPGLLLVGGVVAVSGLAIRAWAAGTVEKGRDLTTSGPYAHTRHPMYLGSFVIGVGLTLAGGSWLWPVVFVAFFLAVYTPTMSRESRELAERFGPAYAEYAAAVPAFVPRPTARATGRPAPATFDWGRYLRYREWEALLGVAAVLIVMTLKLRYAG
jgi:protein-S-isoprenylcysteine O-methyltransferase Ste14